MLWGETMNSIIFTLKPRSRLVFVDRHKDEKGGLYFRGIMEIKMSKKKRKYLEVVVGDGSPAFPIDFVTIKGELPADDAKKLLKNRIRKFTDDELILISDYISYRYLKILTTIDKIATIKQLPIHLMHYMPKLRLFRSDDVITISENPLVRIENMPQSFKAVVVAKLNGREIRMILSKDKYKVKEVDLGTNTKGYLVYTSSESYPEVAIGVREDNISLYFDTHYRDEDCFSEVEYYFYDAYEISTTQKHRSARVVVASDMMAPSAELKLYLTHRLGDIVFVPSECDHFYRESSLEALPKIRSDALKKVEIRGGKLDGDVLTVKEKAYISHPEHGTLVLPEGTYYLRSVAYKERGHD